MSNFAATSGPFSQRLSPVNQATSEIIDAFSNTYYAFWDVYVKFSKLFPLRFLCLEACSSFEGFSPFQENMPIKRRYEIAEFDFPLRRILSR